MNHYFIVIDNNMKKVYSLAGLISKKAEEYESVERNIKVGGFYGFSTDDAENNFEDIKNSLLKAINKKINNVDYICFIIDLFLKESEENELSTTLDLYFSNPGNQGKIASGIEIANKILDSYQIQRNKIDIVFMTRWFSYEIRPLENYNGLKSHEDLWKNKKLKCFFNPVDSNGNIYNKVFVKAKNNAKDLFEYMYKNIFEVLLMKEDSEND